MADAYPHPPACWSGEGAFTQPSLPTPHSSPPPRHPCHSCRVLSPIVLEAQESWGQEGADQREVSWKLFSYEVAEPSATHTHWNMPTRVFPIQRAAQALGFQSLE
jgi:hypothetical protein